MEKQDIPLATITVGSKSGKFVQISVFGGEDPLVLATNFVTEHNLPKEYIPKLAANFSNQIEDAIRARAEKQLNNVSDQDSTLTREASFYNARHSWSGKNNDSGFKAVSMIRMTQTDEVVCTPRSPARSRSPSSVPLANQQFFNRLHNDASSSKQRLENLKMKYEENRLTEIQKSTFRETVGHSVNSPSNKSRSSNHSVMTSEQVNSEVYNRHMAWKDKKQEELAQLSTFIQEQRDKEIDQHLTLKPHILTSPSMQFSTSVKGSNNADNPLKTFHDLYNLRTYYDKKRVEQKQQLEQEMSKNAYFIPKITPRSRKLAMHRLKMQEQEVEEWENTMNSYNTLNSLNNVTFDETSNPSTPYADKKTNNNSIGGGGNDANNSGYGTSTQVDDNVTNAKTVVISPIPKSYGYYNNSDNNIADNTNRPVTTTTPPPSQLVGVTPWDLEGSFSPMVNRYDNSTTNNATNNGAANNCVINASDSSSSKKVADADFLSSIEMQNTQSISILNNNSNSASTPSKTAKNVTIATDSIFSDNINSNNSNNNNNNPFNEIPASIVPNLVTYFSTPRGSINMPFDPSATTTNDDTKTNLNDQFRDNESKDTELVGVTTTNVINKSLPETTSSSLSPTASSSSLKRQTSGIHTNSDFRKSLQNLLNDDHKNINDNITEDSNNNESNNDSILKTSSFTNNYTKEELESSQMLKKNNIDIKDSNATSSNGNNDKSKNKNNNKANDFVLKNIKNIHQQYHKSKSNDENSGTSGNNNNNNNNVNNASTAVRERYDPLKFKPLSGDNNVFSNVNNNINNNIRSHSRSTTPNKTRAKSPSSTTAFTRRESSATASANSNNDGAVARSNVITTTDNAKEALKNEGFDVKTDEYSAVYTKDINRNQQDEGSYGNSNNNNDDPVDSQLRQRDLKVYSSAVQEQNLNTMLQSSNANSNNIITKPQLVITPNKFSEIRRHEQITPRATNNNSSNNNSINTLERKRSNSTTRIPSSSNNHSIIGRRDVTAVFKDDTYVDARNRNKSPTSTRGRSKSPLSIRSTSNNNNTMMDTSMNSSNSISKYPSVKSSTYSLFDRLYEERKRHQRQLEKNQQKHYENFSFTPNIGINSYHEIEENRNDFYNRLHKHHDNRVVELLDAYLEQRKEQDAMSIHKHIMTPREKNHMVHRLWENKQRNEIKLDAKREIEEEKIIEERQRKYVITKSDKIANEIHIRALSEIFDVLKVSAMMQSDNIAAAKSKSKSVSSKNINNIDKKMTASELNVHHEDSNNNDNDEGNNNSVSEPHTPSHEHKQEEEQEQGNDDDTKTSASLQINTEPIVVSANNINSQPNTMTTSGDNSITSPTIEKSNAINHLNDENLYENDILDTELAQPSVLHPKLLADSIQRVINDRKPYSFTRIQFIQTVQTYMFNGLLPPIGYLLSYPEQQNKPIQKKRTKELNQYQQSDLRQLTLTPDLHITQNRNIKLLKERNHLRNEGKQRIEDSLLQYSEYQEQRVNEKKLELLQEENQECTFIPNVNSPYMIKYKRNHQQDQHIHKRSHSVPSRLRGTHVYLRKSSGSGGGVVGAKGEGDSSQHQMHDDECSEPTITSSAQLAVDAVANLISRIGTNTNTQYSSEELNNIISGNNSITGSIGKSPDKTKKSSSYNILSNKNLAYHNKKYNEQHNIHSHYPQQQLIRDYDIKHNITAQSHQLDRKLQMKQALYYNRNYDMNYQQSYVALSKNRSDLYTPPSLLSTSKRKDDKMFSSLYYSQN